MMGYSSRDACTPGTEHSSLESILSLLDVAMPGEHASITS
jgi:hypothetical protein